MSSSRLTPAGPDDHPLAGGGVRDGSVVMDECRVKGHTVHIQSDGRELDAERQVMPLTVTHLAETRQNQWSEVTLLRGSLVRNGKQIYLSHFWSNSEMEKNNVL